MRIDTRATLGIVVAAGVLAAAAGAAAGPAQTMPMTTKSPAAHDQLVELQRRIETFQFTANEDLARKIVAADPDFALGEYYLSAVSPAVDPAAAEGLLAAPRTAWTSPRVQGLGH